ncbi:hypothetical protein AGLY_015494 [Aphis glycines]|uniref:Uncharacterized protein n=1 Tax=Aphis glycines TaxID=307491 RepID=A0A6G0T0M9_APHGL|nr:hypothetical protein AGLY_015494 [Aphis glycines]
MTAKSKECVLYVDKMPFKSFLFFDFKKDEIIVVYIVLGNNLRIFFVSTTFTGYDLQAIIFQTIQKLSNISFNVIVMISNLGSNFKRFALPPPPQTYFNVGDKEIVYMFDPLHLLKETKNNFFNCRFKSQNKIAEKIHLTNFYDSDKNVHLNPNSFQKMRVKFACYVFSHTVVAGMTTFFRYN